MSETEDVNYSNMLLKLLVQLYLWGLAYMCVCVCVGVLSSRDPYCLTVLNGKIMCMLSSSLTVMLSCMVLMRALSQQKEP